MTANDYVQRLQRKCKARKKYWTLRIEQFFIGRGADRHLFEVFRNLLSCWVIAMNH